MLQLRPTFSESWYRVKDLRARLRPSAQISRQYYRGERWYVVRDPAGNQFHRLNDAAYRFVGLLDGTRTVGEAWDLVGGQLADDAPTQPEVIQVLSQLHAANLIESNVPPDALVLLRRHKQQMKRKMQGRLMNVLFPRIPLWDPDRFLCRWMPLVRPFLSKFGAILWFVMVIAAISVIAPRWDLVQQDTKNAIAPSNWLWLWAVFVLIKFIHELGHAFSCRRFGGEIHEMGIMFLVFIPTPYVDASTAWAFPSRWARMFVGAAGMIIELFVAAICAFIWWQTNPTTLTHQLAYNVMLIASVSTILFNANPLLRYDGYYMLSDFLEIPNLQQKSKEYLLGLIKRHVFRTKMQQPLPPPWQRFELAAYGVLSTVYRIFIGIMIILLVAYQLPVQLRWLGYLMAVGGVVTWLLVPVFKTAKYLTLDPELHRKRGRAALASLAFAGCVVAAIGFIPIWVYVHAAGVLEPQEYSDLFAEVPGFVVDVKAKDGDVLKAGDVILVCQDRDLEAQISVQEATLAAEKIRMRQAGSDRDGQASKKIIQHRIKSIEAELADLNRQREELTIRAPIAGRLIAPDIESYFSRFFNRGDPVARVATVDRLVVKATLDQGDVELVPDEGVDETEVRLVGKLDQVLQCEGVRKIGMAQAQLPDPALSHAGGGTIAPDPKDPEGRTPLIKQFELRVRLANPDNEFVPGQRAYVRMKVFKKPIFWQVRRALLQLIESANNE